MRLTERGLENAAVYYLQRYPSSAANLRRVLQRKVRRARSKGDERELDVDAAIAAVVARMIEAGLVDDAAYSRGLTESLHRRGMPARAIRQRLRQKGIAAEHVDAALERLREQHAQPDEVAAWALARRRRLGPYRDADARADRRQRDLAAMARAGYSYGLASSVIDADEPPV